MAIKQISIDALSVGMYVVRLDRPLPDEGQYTNKHHMECLEDIQFLKTSGVHSVIIDPTLGKDVTPDDSEASRDELAPLSQDLAAARMVRSEAMTALQGVFEGVKTGAPINNTLVKKTVSSLMQMLLHQHDMLLSLIHMQRGDVSMFGHAVNVCTFSLVVGKSQGFPKLQLEQLGAGALLHDVGELRLPRNLLWKHGVYSEQERRLIQQHPLLGVNILSESDGIHQESLRIVREHHERIDGSGYPSGLTRSDISPLSEIVGIVDIYDAMLSSREGRPALLPTQAIKELYRISLKGLVDRHWTERIIRCLGIYPVGSLVELSTGELAVVTVGNPDDTLRPTVRVICDETHQVYSPVREVDLSNKSALTQEKIIVRALDPTETQLDVETYFEEAVEKL